MRCRSWLPLTVLLRSRQAQTNPSARPEYEAGFHQVEQGSRLITPRQQYE
jgi:hypothetical protein